MKLPLKSRANASAQNEGGRSALSLYTVRELVAEFLVDRIESKCGEGRIPVDVAIESIERIKQFNIYHSTIASLLTHKREVFNNLPAPFGTDLIRELYLFVAAHIVTGFGQEELYRFCDDLLASAHMAHVVFDEHESSAANREDEREAYAMVLKNAAAEWVPMVILLKLTHLEIETEEAHGG